MMNKEENLKWLRHRMKEYHACRSNIGDVEEEMERDGKLGPGFSSIDRLEELDIGMGLHQDRPTSMPI
jgi:hypothetical protein